MKVREIKSLIKHRIGILDAEAKATTNPLNRLVSQGKCFELVTLLETIESDNKEEE